MASSAEHNGMGFMNKRKMGFGILAVAVVAALATGSIYAFFSDTETSNNNSFQAGTLDLHVNDAVQWADAEIDINNVVPGTDGVRTIKLTNGGSIAGTVSATITTVEDDPGVTTEPEAELPTADEGELSENLDVQIWVDVNNNGIIDGTESAVYTGLLSNVNNAAWDLGALAVNANMYVSVHYEVADTVGNEIQADECTFSIGFTLTQS